PSVNTVKRVFRREPVFFDTLERIWDYLRRAAAEQKETLPDLADEEDYLFVESSPRPDDPPPERAPEPPPPGSPGGWLARQVPRPNRLSTGRRDALARLHAALKAGPTALVPDPQALTGLGGIGKTQTAIAYLYRHRNDYNGVYWISAETVDALNDG